LSEGGSELAIDSRPDGVGFWIHVTPRARRESVAGLHGDALRVSVKAPPVEGKANEACARAMAEALEVPRSSVQIDPGARGRRKRVDISGEPETLLERLAALAQERRLR
jgi:uncharacterized protein (TIGR00251 family)